MRRLRLLLLAPVVALLSACNLVVLNPAGDVASQQGDLLMISTLLMLIIIVPVMGLIVFFAWKYRASNKEAEADYRPDWDHSTSLELVIWAAPLMIIICLGALTWAGTHLLDPYRPIDRIKPGQAVEESVEPLQVNVVALDWKWMFIYPQYGVATVNELAAPVDRPIRFHITSSSVMNSFYIPALAGQIYAMPGMETKLHAVINRPGEYEGFSANYSGDGFSHMRFAFHGLDQSGFDQWIAGVRQGGQTLDRDRYLELEKPSEKVPVMRFGAVDGALWDAILNMCVEPGKMCMGEMMAIDKQGGLSMASVRNTMPLVYDKYAGRGKSPAYFGSNDSYVMTICTPLQAEAAAADRMRRAELDTVAGPTSLERLTGQGLSPGQTPMAALTTLARNPFATGPVPTDVRSAPNA
ncbi:ubiquinol oxidase subunit II [Brevundimonas vesicularis]|uniref:ubiquinol oxidase subunit II n=1 Tax=Brevundimonas vesicularis TaxID=41276 RepID=UPI0027D9118C|nr:ubiquinol oxidase subunit II [Brevundimonas vesicularis]